MICAEFIMLETHQPIIVFRAIPLIAFHGVESIYTRIIKNIFNKNERRCRDVKTQKASKQGWEANLGPKIKQTTSI